MSKYIKLFENHTQYESFVVGGGDTPFIKPNVSLCVQENDVHYNPLKWANEYFTIESLEDDNTIYLKASNTAITKTVSASTDNGSTWIEYTSSTGGSGTTLATLNKGDKLLVKGENSTYATDSYYNQFNTTKQFEAKGNIMALVNGDSFANADELTESYTFGYLFYQCTGLTSVENLVLPATTLADYCYQYMFKGCTSLTTAPELPATTLVNRCYGWMFQNCESLRTAPVLPATTLADDCYSFMFNKCTSLTTAPVLPATTLVNGCYERMFQNCTSLTTAPELPATTLADDCYSFMFQNCTSLTTAPELPATTLVNNCYLRMFYGCTSLNYIKCLATNISANSNIDNWVNGVASSGTFTKAASMTSWITGVSGIPDGWTVQTATA